MMPSFLAPPPVFQNPLPPPVVTVYAKHELAALGRLPAGERCECVKCQEWRAALRARKAR